MPGPIELLIIALILLTQAFWVWMLVDCALYFSGGTKPKVIWIIFVALTNWVGALIYLLAVRSRRGLQAKV